MNKFHLSLLVLAFSVNHVFSQHQEVPEKPSMWKGKNNETADTLSLLHAFKSGTMHGHFRYYFSHTNNENQLSDYFANAIGGGLRYESAKYHRFQFAVSGFYFFNIGSSNFKELDPLTNQQNRYEIGLFDVNDPGNHQDMDRLEELHLKYNFKKGHLVFGRQLINTPMINLQDGRMRATGVEGIWGDYQFFKKLKIEGGFLYAISPRSTTEWFRGGESIGVYASGVDVNGKKSAYAGNVHSKGVGVLGAHYEPISGIKVHGWNYLIENVLNSALLQLDFSKKIKSEMNLVAGLQAIKQHAIGDGGNHDADLAYVEKGNTAFTFGAKVGFKTKKWSGSLNYNRITAEGRYLFPREWGRDPFFTFMPRERNEGFGDVHAFLAKVERNLSEKRMKIAFGAGYFDLPDALNYSLNKYGMPSYLQVNLDVRYAFNSFFKGLEAQVLIAVKKGIGETYDNDRFVINKVNMGLLNVVLNYHF